MSERMTLEEVDVLARYNAERARGIAHTASWVTRMAALQRRFNQEHPGGIYWSPPRRSLWQRLTGRATAMPYLGVASLPVDPPATTAPASAHKPPADFDD